MDLLGEAGAPVVARLVLGDQAQLADLGLERRRALDAGDGLGEADHLAHPRAGLGGGEVGADAGAQVAGGADVEDPGAGRRGRGRPRARGGGPRRGGACGAGRSTPCALKVWSSSRVCTPRPPSRSISPCSTSTVARASDSARWLGVVVAWKALASDESLQLGASSRVTTRRASLAVSSTSNAGQGRPCRAGEVLEEADVERRVVGDQHATPRRTRGTPAAPTRSTARRSTMELVMPVSTAMNGGIWVWGLTRVWNSPSTSPPRTLTAPISVIIDPPSADPPVVSRSTTQNVRSRSGRPSSSNVRCASHRCARPAGPATGREAVVVMFSTLGPPADTVARTRGYRSGHLGELSGHRTSELARSRCDRCRWSL